MESDTDQDTEVSEHTLYRYVPVASESLGKSDRKHSVDNTMLPTS